MLTPKLGCILVIDDEIELMTALVEALTLQGYEAEGCTSGMAALERLERQSYDLMLTDLMMPEMDGITLLKKGLKLDPHLVGIIMTGYGTVQTAVEAMKVGAFDYVLKPFKMTEVLPVMARAMEVHRLRLENIQLRETVAIYNLSQTIAFSLDSKLILEKTADAALQQTEADEVSIMLLTPEGDELYIAAVRGEDRAHLLGQRLPIQQGIAGWVARQNRPLLLNGQVHDPRFAPIRPRAEIHSAIAMPMLAAGKLVGVLNVNSLSPRRSFTPGQIKALGILISTAAGALENEALYNALQASEKRFRTWIEYSSDLISVLDFDGNILYESPSIERLLGYSPEEVVGRNVYDLLHAEDAPKVRALLPKGPPQPGISASVEYRVPHRDGTWRYFEAIGRSYTDERGEVVALINSRDITERKKSEEAIASMQKHFQALIENAPDGIALLGLDGKLRQVTPSTQQILGYTPGDVEGEDPAVLTHPDDLPMLLGLLNDLIQQPGKIVTTQYRFRRKDGSWCWLESTISNLLGEPSVQAIVFNYRDITKRKQAVDALREAEAKYRSLIEQIPAITYMAAADEISSTVYISPQVTQTLGFLPEELTGDSDLWVQRIHPEDRALVRQKIEHSHASGDPFVAEYRLIARDGHEVWISDTADFIRDEAGQPLFLQGVMLDITERKKAEEKIILQANLLNAVGSAVIATDLQGRVIYWNPAAERLYGWSATEALGRSVVELTVTESTAEQAQEIMEQLSAGQAWSGEFPVKRRDGTAFPAFVSDSPLLDASGKLIGVIGVSNDISNLKQAEAALKASEQRYRDLAENFPNGVVCVYNKDLVLVFDAGLELKQSGYSAEDFLGKHFTELTPAETWEIARPHLQAAFEGKVSSYEASGVDGRYYTNNVAPLHGPSGEIDEILVVSQDVTSLRRAESTVREKEQLLSETQRISHVGSWSYDVLADRLTFSDEMYRLLDVTPEHFDHSSQAFVLLIYPSDRELALSWLENTRVGIQVKELNVRIFRKNGELRYLHCTGAINFDSHGKPVRFIGTMQDVTERKQAEIQINQQIKRLTALTEIDRAIISSFDEHYTLNVLLAQVLSQLQVDAADILLLNPDTKMLEFKAGQGFRTKLRETVRLRVGESHAGRAAKERRIIRILDLREAVHEPTFKALIAAEGFMSYLAVPLIVKGKVKGVMNVFHRLPLQPYQDWLDFLNTLAGQAAIAVENASLFGNLQAKNEELSQAYDATIEGWSRAMDLRDRETEGHTQRVTQLTLELARARNVDEAQLVHIRHGALLHDIGKLGIPDQILFKPDQLTPEEFEVMKKHPEWAYEMLAPISYLKPALNIPYFHHEKWDGTGYPLGLKGEQIPLEARIFSIVDVWDALLSDRPYRKAWPGDKVLDYIRAQAGKHFDPELVELFLRIL